MPPHPISIPRDAYNGSDASRKRKVASFNRAADMLEAHINKTVSDSPRNVTSSSMLVDVGSGRFRYFASCSACGFSTEPSRVKGVTLKLWNEAKPARRKGRS